MKSIQNALALLILTTSLSACSLVKPLQCETVPVDRVPLNLSEPQPLKLAPARWRIVTPDNIDSIWKEIENSGNEVVLFAVTAEGYEQLALDFSAIRNHINHQRTIIIKYKEYYEKNNEQNSKNISKPN